MGSLRNDPYLVGNVAWCSTCFPEGKPDTTEFGTAVNWRDRVRPGCNECSGHGRVAFSAETIVRNTRAGGPQPDPPFVPTRLRPSSRVERVRPQIHRRTT